MGKLVDDDTLRCVRIALEGEDVFLSAGAQRVLLVAA